MKIGTGGFSVVADNEYKLFRIVVAEGEQVQFETAGFAGATLGIDRKLIHSVEPIKWTYKKANKWTELPLYLDKDGEKVSLHNEYGDLTLPSDYGIWDTETQVRAELLDVDGNLYFDEITLYRLSPKSGFRVVLNNTVAQLQKNKLGNFNLEDLKFSYKVYDNETLLSEGAADGQYEVKPSFDYGTVEIGGGRGGVVNLTSTLENEMEVRLGFSINKVGSETNTRKTAYFKVINHSLGHSWHVSSSSMLLEYDESGAKPVSIKVGLLDGTKYASRELYEVTYVNGDNIQGSLTEEADHYTYTLTEMNQDESQVTFYIKTINNDVAQKTVSLKRRAQSVPVLDFGFNPNPITFTYGNLKNILEDYVEVDTVLEYGRKSLFDSSQEHLLEYCDINPVIPELYINDIFYEEVANNQKYRFSFSPTFLITNNVIEYPISFEGVVKVVGFPETPVKATGQIQLIPSPSTSDGLVSDVDVYYGLSDSSTIPPSEWQTEAPEWVNGKFMWTKTVKTFGNGLTSETDPTCITGAMGNDGVGVDYIKEWYYWSASPTSVPEGAEWAEAPGAWRPSEYLWTKTEIRYSDGSFTETAQICVSGAQGESGVNAKQIRVSGEQVFKYKNDFGTLVAPTSITLSTEVQGVSSPKYVWSYKVPGAASAIIQGATGSTYTLSPSDAMWGSHKSITINCEIEEGVHDEITIVKVSDGSDAYTVILTNESHSFPSQSNGNIPTQLSTTAQVIAMKGAVAATPIIGASTPSVSGLVTSSSGNTITITASAGTSLPDSGSINFPITVDGQVFTKTFSWTKTKQGASGSNGADAQYVRLTGDQVFKFAAGATEPAPKSIDLTASLIGLSGNGQWSYRKPGQTSQTALGAAGPGQRTIQYNSSEWLSTDRSITYRFAIGSKYDEITLVKIYDGEEGDDAYTVILTNESHTIACNELGSPIEGEIGQTGKAKSTIEVYKAGQKLVGGGSTPTAGQFYYTIGSSPDAVAQKMPSSNDTFYISSVSGESGTIPLTINIEGKSNVNKIMSFSKAKKGSAGADGNDAITMSLSNDAHTIPTDEGGNNGIFTDAKTQVFIHSSVSDVSSSWTITPQASPSITGSWNNTNKTYTVSNMTTDNGEVVFTASRAGFTSLSKTFTLSKNKQGISGEDAVIYTMNLSASTIAKKVDNTLSPSTITVSGTKTIGNTSPASYAGRFRVSESLDGSSFTVKYTSSANEASKTYTPSTVNIKALKFEHFLAGGTTTKLDEQTIPVLSDGVNGTGVEYVDVEYGVSTDPKVEPAAGSWSTNSPTWDANKFIWTRTKTKFTGIVDPVYSKPACITGNSGLGVSNIIEQYALTSSSSTPPTEGQWDEKVPAWETGKYIWTRSKITYSNGSVGYTEPYCDKSWEAIDGIVIGGTNLLKKSNPNITSGNYNIANFYFATGNPSYAAPVNGNVVTVSVKAALASGKTGIGLYNSGGNVHLTTLTSADLKDGIYRKTFTWNVSTAANTHLSVYTMPSSVSGSTVLEWIKLERGNRGTDWSAHPQDEITGDQLPPSIITADKIQAGAITAGKISADAIQANNIQAGAITAGKLSANSVVAGNIQAGSISTGHISTNKLEAQTVLTGHIDANSIEVRNLNADNITSGQVSADRVEVGNVYNIIKNQPETEKDTVARPVLSHSDGYKYYNITASGSAASRMVLWSSSVYEFAVNEEYVFDSYGFKTGSPAASVRMVVLYTDNSEANVSGAVNLNVGTTPGIISQVVVKITSEPNKAKIIKKVMLVVDKSAVSGSICLRNLRAVKKTSGALIQDGTITADKIHVNGLNASVITAGTIDASKINVNNIDASKITVGTMSADRIDANSFNSKVINVDNLNASKIKVGTMSADRIDANSFNAKVISVDNLDASKIKTGTLDATKVEIKGGTLEYPNDRLELKGSRILFADGVNTAPRIQIGRFDRAEDGTPNFGIIVTNNEGTPIFDSTVGGLLQEGFLNETITSDKLVSVGLDKLPDEVVTVNNLSAQTISAKQVTVKGDLTVERADGSITFAVDTAGDVMLDGTLQNKDYVAGESGYLITPDGNTEFNNTVVRGTVELPNAGMTEKGFSVIEQKTFSVGGNISAWARDAGYIVQQIIALNLNSVTIPVRFQIPSATSSEVVVDSSDTLLASQIYDSLRSQGYADLVKIIFEPYPYIAGGAVPETDFNPTDKAAFFANWAIQMKNAISQLSFVPDEYYVSSNMIHLENEYDSWVALREELRAVLPNSKSIYRTNWWITATWSQSHIDAYNAKLANPVFGLFDVIAIAAYFELNESASPSVATLKADLLSSSLYGRGQNIYQEIKNFYTEWGKPIYFGELGCAHYDFAAREPWNTDPSAVYNETVQKNLFQAYVETFGDESWFKGFSIFAIGDDTSKFNIFGKQAGTYIASLNTSVDNKFSPVRIWAGSSFENRDSAPFRVLQDGTVYALNGYYSGILDGELQTDNVHIHDDSIEINEVSGTHDARVVKLTKSGSHINSDSFTMGNGKFQYLAGTNELNLNDANISLSSAGGLTSLKFDRASGVLGGLNLIARANSGHHVLRHSADANRNGTLVIDSEGGQGAVGDFSFTRKNYTEEVLVDVHGSVSVKTSIKSTTQPVEMRAVPGEGWGFFIV